MGPDWEPLQPCAVKEACPPLARTQCSHGLSAAIEAEQARITLRARITLCAWHAASAAEHAKEELLRKKRRLKLVKNKKLEDKSKIRWPSVKTIVWLNGDEWVAVD